MTSTKRVFIATLLGIIFGFICWGFAASNPETPALPWSQTVIIILSRTLIGFTIGISVLRIAWWLHGIIIGAIGSLPGSFAGFAVPGKELFIFFGFLIMGVIYGFLIELFTTIVFKTKRDGA